MPCWISNKAFFIPRISPIFIIKENRMPKINMIPPNDIFTE